MKTEQSYFTDGYHFVEQARSWAESVFFTTDSAFQIMAIVITLIAGNALYAPLRNRLAQLANQVRPAWLSSFVHRFEAVIVPLVALTALWLISGYFKENDKPYGIMRIAVSLLSVWVVIRFTSSYVGNRRLARWIALLAWSVAALNIVGLLEPTMTRLDAVGLTFGQTHITLLLVIKGLLTFAALVWGALTLGSVSERHIHNMTNLTPSLRVLIIKMVRIVLAIFALTLGLNALGIDLTSLAVLSGAIGVGIGFGLQKVVSNFISGIILLLDRSIKPGDVIHIGETYGWVNTLGARCVSLITRDGKEHLIPNELLITERVENWSYSNSDIRIHIPVGVSYDSDLRKALALMQEIAQANPRILQDKPINSLVTGFADSAVNLELRAWINDPANGIGNVTSDILLAIWDSFHTNNIKFPYPQMDVHLREDSVLNLLKDS